MCCLTLKIHPYGHTFSERGQRQMPTQLIDRARNLGNQVGQWLDGQKAADFLAGFGKKGAGAYDVQLPLNVGGCSFLPNGTEIIADMVRVIVKPNGSIRTAFPFSSLYPN